MEVTIKACSKCKASKPVSDFHNKKQSLEGKDSWCKGCHKKINQRGAQVKHRYGITMQVLDDMIAKQGGKCAICETALILNKGRQAGRSADSLCIDHCHETGVIRGLLCWRCNIMIGQSKDSVEILQKAILYLSKQHY